MNFAFDSSALTQKNKENIAIFAQTVKNKNYYNITVQGHTDSVGTNEYNQKLSERRAKAVKDELVKNGIDASKIEVIGYGEEKPIADNGTAEGRAKNRRSVIFAEIN
jgi:Outer membrane protein and related peptidoglycan-associated (lipo)proteins